MKLEQGLFEQATSDPEKLQKLYDGWAADYDHDIAAWGYEAPRVAVTYLRDLISGDALVLDAGCGTGLVGTELKSAGFNQVVGIDLSPDSLTIAAATEAYQSLEQIDLTVLPTDLPTAHFGALLCIGVMSYLPDIENTCREFCRLLKSGSPIVMTQRSDLFETRNTQKAFDALVADGTWEELEITPAHDYLPANPEFVGTGVKYCVFRRS